MCVEAFHHDPANASNFLVRASARAQELQNAIATEETQTRDHNYRKHHHAIELVGAKIVPSC